LNKLRRNPITSAAETEYNTIYVCVHRIGVSQNVCTPHELVLKEQRNPSASEFRMTVDCDKAHGQIVTVSRVK